MARGGIDEVRSRKAVEVADVERDVDGNGGEVATVDVVKKGDEGGEGRK